jgi:transposase
LLFDLMLERFRRLGLLKAHGRQRTDSSHVPAAVRALNRLELVRETFRHTLDVLATAVPTWVLAQAWPEWVERYQGRTDEVRLPKSKEAQLEFAETIGADGHMLLAAVYRADAPHWLREVPAVDILRRVWLQNYLPTEAGVRWRTTDDGLPKASQFVSSPFDTDAHLGRKHTTGWVGYKVHLTETCEDDAPNLITHVETTAAPTADGEVTPRVHRALHEQRLLPQVHVVDTGYLDAELLVTSRFEYGVQLLGPTRHDHRWQTRAAAGFGVQRFTIDWERQQAICPEGRASSEWTPRIDNRGNDSIYLHPLRAVGLWSLPQPQSVHSVTNQVSPAWDRHSTAGAVRSPATATRSRSYPRLRPRVRASRRNRGHHLTGACGGAECGTRVTEGWPEPISVTS